MLAGRQAYPAAETTSDTLAAVLTRDPDWSALPPETPVRVRRLIERCLRKDLRMRLRDIGDAQMEIVELMREPREAQSPPRSSAGRLAYVLAVLTVLFAASTAWLWWTRASTTQSSAERVRFDLTPEGMAGNPGDQGLAAMIPFPALSPDGRSLAYVATAGGRNELWLHQFGTGTRQPVRGSEGAVFPFWSPQSDAIAFFAGDQLKRVNLTDESVQVIASGMTATTTAGSLIIGATWGPDDVILLGQGSGPLVRISARGGVAEAVTSLDSTRGETSHRVPEFLPDGRHYTYSVTNSNPAQNGAFIGAIDSSERRPLPGIVGRSRYSVSGHLLFVRQRNLWAQPFDVSRLELMGEPIQIAANVGVNPTIGPFSVSHTGAVAFRAMAEVTRSRLVWFDRSGREIGSPGREGEYRNIDLSPDGRFVVFQAGAPDVWVLDLQRGVVSRVTTDGGSFPVWSHDGRDVYFRATRTGVAGAFRRTVGTAAGEELLVKGDVYINGVWAQRRFTYTALAPGGFDIWLAGSSPGDAPTRLTETRFGETYTTVAPNGAAVAYAIDETGRWEVMVQTIASGHRTQVSALGGILPKWSADGRELFYIAPDARLMAVPVKWDGDTPQVGVPIPLFQTRIVGGGNYVAGFGRQYDVASDGRFLMQVPSGDERPSPITVILNWSSP
jgi:Tol biopolymer transport system component